MAVSDSIAVFVPILFLLVLELANIARSSADLTDLASSDRKPLTVLGHDTVWGYRILPNLGRFIVIHWMSMMLLSLTTFITLTFASGILQAGLLAATALLLWFYPLVEVHEYDALFADGDFPQSFSLHFKYVTGIIILGLFGEFVLVVSHLLLGDLSGRIVGVAYLLVSFAVVPYLASRHFTAALRDELAALP